MGARQTVPGGGPCFMPVLAPGVAGHAQPLAYARRLADMIPPRALPN